MRIAPLLAALTMASCTCAETDPLCREIGVGFVQRTTSAFSVDTVVENLEVPWGIAFIPDDSGDFVVSERGGRLVLVTVDGTTSTLATVPIDANGEGGLLGVAIDPADEEALYLYATFGDENRVERWLLDRVNDPPSAAFEAIVVDGIPAGSRHDGGRLRFGPDGLLYASTGEIGQPELSRDDASLAGKLLRVEADGVTTTILKGIRNSQGFAFLPDGRFVVADHGPSGELGRTGHDELNVASEGDDLGWPERWSCEADDVLVPPRVTWVSALPPGGIALVETDVIDGWEGSVLVAALGARQLQRVTLRDDQQADVEIVLDDLGRLRDVVQLPDGSGFLVSTSNCDGRGDCPASGDQIVRVTAP